MPDTSVAFPPIGEESHEALEVLGRRRLHQRQRAMHEVYRDVTPGLAPAAVLDQPVPYGLP